MTGSGSDDGEEPFEPRTDGDMPAQTRFGDSGDEEHHLDSWPSPGSNTGEQPPDGQRDDDMTEVFGSHADPRSIEPGTPSFEHAFFVVLGVLTGIGALLSLVGII